MSCIAIIDRKHMAKQILRLVVSLLSVFSIAIIFMLHNSKDGVWISPSIYHERPVTQPNTIIYPLQGREADTNMTCVTGRPCTYSDVVDLRVIVITFNRPNSLSKLLRSLDTLVLDGDRAALEIWIDRSRKKSSVHQKTLEVASSFRWKGGPTHVHIQTSPAGIIGQWIDTWRPRDDSDVELGLIFEDDVSVSAYGYRWLRAVHRAYRRRTDFVGASLNSDEMSIMSHRPKGPLAAPKNDTLLMYKCLGPWGFSPRPLHWRRFQDWFHQHKPSVAPHFRPYLPDTLDTLLTKWYKNFEKAGTQDSMWTMWFAYYMHIEQVYAVYNNLGVYTGRKDVCLSINRREVGLHNWRKGREDFCQLMTVWKDEYIVFPKEIVRLHWDGSPMGRRLY